MNKDIRISTSFFTHIKTRKSIKKYGSDFVLCLFKLWIYAAQNRAKGVLDGLSSDDIELLSDWNGDLQFTDICLELGWLDKNEQGVFSIHGWEEHQSFAMFAEERSAKARRAASKRWGCKENNMEEHEAMQDECSEHTSSIHEAMQDECSTYAPSPIPSPSPVPVPKHNTTRARGSDVSLPEHFESFWSAFPKKVGKQAALTAWKKSKTKPSIEILLEALEQQKASPQWQKDGGQFIPNPATWINQGRWDDEVQQVPLHLKDRSQMTAAERAIAAMPRN